MNPGELHRKTREEKEDEEAIIEVAFSAKASACRVVDGDQYW